MSTKKIQILGSLGNKIYTQNDEPTDADDGSLWVDLDAEMNEESAIIIDPTLTVNGAAADAKAVGEALAGKQPAGNYLTAIPAEYITDSELLGKGYLTNYTETDPTVPDWAKASTKPSYTASEIGLTTEMWTFTLEDGSTVTKAVYVG